MWLKDDLRLARHKAEQLLRQLELTDALTDGYAYERLCLSLFQAAKLSEDLTKITRQMPIYTGDPRALEAVDDLTLEALDFHCAYTPEGWFHFRLPALLPRKEKGDASYIRSSAASFLKRYFSQQERLVFEGPVVLAILHGYNAGRPERAWRDHDNIEVNVIVDLVAMNVLRDDTGLFCTHYYTSREQAADCTDFFVVPQADFVRFLESEGCL